MSLGLETFCWSHPESGMPAFGPHLSIPNTKGSLGGSVVRNLLANSGDMGSIPWVGKIPGGGNGNPLQYSCLENSRDRGELEGSSPWDHKELDTTEQVGTYHQDQNQGDQGEVHPGKLTLLESNPSPCSDFLRHTFINFTACESLPVSQQFSLGLPLFPMRCCLTWQKWPGVCVRTLRSWVCHLEKKYYKPCFLPKTRTARRIQGIFNFLIIIIFLGVELLSNVVLASVVQQSKSATQIHTPPCFLDFLPIQFTLEH